MLQITTGIVLSRRAIRERDRLVMLYTRELGRLRVRFIGVDRPNGKLKAFTEPFVRADFRIYLKPGADIATAAGGAVLDVYPVIRTDYARTLEAFYCCELLLRLTPEHEPNARQHDLLAEALTALDRAPNPWIPAAYALRLLAFSGFGRIEWPLYGLSRGLWTALHNDAFESLEAWSGDEDALFRVRELLRTHIPEKAGQLIKSERFLTATTERRVPALNPL